VYPNPTSNFIQIIGALEEFEYEIFDINGKIVMKGNNKNQNTIKVENLVNGVYFLNIDAFNTFKFIKH